MIIYNWKCDMFVKDKVTCANSSVMNYQVGFLV